MGQTFEGQLGNNFFEPNPKDSLGLQNNSDRENEIFRFRVHSERRDGNRGSYTADFTTDCLRIAE